MDTTTEPFSLEATCKAVADAFAIIVASVGFQVATAGLAVALVIGVLGLIALSQHKKTGRPLLVVTRKLAIFCGLLSLPGLITLLTAGRLPPVNQLSLHPLGLLGFWSLVTAHLCMEEMNFEWFQEK